MRPASEWQMAAGRDMPVNEAALMARILAAFPPARKALLGIGDDAAILQPGRPLTVTADMLIEGIDFTRDVPASFIARKSLTANLSDLAAMGATPQTFLLSIGIPKWFEPQFDRFVDALANDANRYEIELIGGDLSASPHLVVSITAMGTLEGPRALLRSDGVTGDRIFLSRPVGGSSAGLALLGKQWKLEPNGTVLLPDGEVRGYAEREFGASALRMQLAPEPETALGIRLAAIPEIHACIDVSDGLSTDLERLCHASGCGARIEYERIPQFPDLGSSGALLGINSDRASLHGGEEYALLFTSTLAESELSSRLGRPVYFIGRLTAAEGLVLVRNGADTPLVPAGFDHFA